MLNINRDKFISDYWNYYKNLENDFINLTRFVKVCDTNYETCSDEIIKQFYAVCSEIDVVFKIICEFDLSSFKKIYDYHNAIKQKHQEIFEASISILHSDIIITPFKAWGDSLLWWQDYNDVKHNRFENYKKGNLLNLLNAITALYYLELYLVRKIGVENGEIDVPNSISKIFKLNNFKTKYTVTADGLYPIISEDIDKLFNN